MLPVSFCLFISSTDKQAIEKFYGKNNKYCVFQLCFVIHQTTNNTQYYPLTKYSFSIMLTFYIIGLSIKASSAYFHYDISICWAVFSFDNEDYTQTDIRVSKMFSPNYRLNMKYILNKCGTSNGLLTQNKNVCLR